MDYSFRGVQCKKEEAELHCWGTEKVKGPLTRLYFKFPKLEDDEVRIRVTHTGLCRTDVHKIMGDWNFNITWPIVTGHEIVGYIEKIGAKVKKFKVGDKACFGVFRDCCGNCKYCLSGNDQLCKKCPFVWTYDPHLGGYSTFLQAKEAFTFALPNNLYEYKAPPILCAGVTVFAPIKRFCVPGGKCAVIGIGGLGHMAVQYAHKMGMKVYCLTTTREKEELSKMLGSDQTILTSNKEEMDRFAKEEVDLIINSAMMTDISPYMAGLKLGTGVFVQTAIPPVSNPMIYNNLDVVVGQKTLVGSIVGSRREVQETLDFSSQFGVLPITENFTWADMPKAFEKLNHGRPIFRCVCDVAETFDEAHK